MIKTFTTTSCVNNLQKQPEHANPEIMGGFDADFYETLQPELDKLIRNPSEETIAKILAYAAQK